MENKLGIAGLLAVTIIWGGGFVASDIALAGLTPFQIMAIRFLIATIVMAVLAGKEIKTIRKEEWKCGAILGFFLFGGFALQIIGLQYTTPSKNAFLTATNVVFVPFIAMVLYKKKVKAQSLVGAAMAIIGAGVLSLQADFSMGIGDALTLICAVCFAFQIFLTGEFVGRIRPMVLNFIQMSMAFVCSLVGYLFSGELAFHADKNSIWAVLYLGLISTCLTYFLQTLSQRYVEETKAAIILSMEAVFGTVFSVILLHEQVTAKMLIGSALILGAVLVSELPVFAGKEAKDVQKLGEN